MRAFVTGATGFIGSHLADSLLNDPGVNEVRCLVRDRLKWLEGKGCTIVRGDLHSIPELIEGTEGCDILFHLAGVVKARTEREFELGNIDGTENLLRIARRNGIRKVVILSSLAAAGPAINGTPRRESDPMEPVSMYGRSKLKMEERVHSITADKLDVTILRPPAVYGPREDQIFLFFQMMNRRICPIIGDGDRPRISLIHVFDLIRAIRLAGESKSTGVNTYFVSGPGDVSWNEIKNYTSRALGKKPITLYVRPAWVRRVAALAEKAGNLAGFWPALNREKAAEIVLEWTCNDNNIRSELGYEAGISLESGIAETMQWYREQNWL
ncbi:MAG: NAD(P)-dependent oxidoreductase [Balneolaceae bacterium]